MLTTKEYFNLSSDNLLQDGNRHGYTKEECLLFDSGLEVVFFDNEGEMAAEQEEFNAYIQSKNFEVKIILLTINERIAVVLA